MAGSDAPVQIRLAGALLRHHREAARWTVHEAAAELGCDASKISRIETGHRRPAPADMRALLAAYGVAGREVEAIAELTRDAGAGWWGEYRGLLPDAVVDRALLESVAGDVLVWEPLAPPGFLQTRDYAAAIAGADPALETGEQRLLAVQLAARRAAGLLGRGHGRLAVVIGEAALRQEVGGVKTMLGQLRELEGRAGQLSLRVAPFDAGAHPAVGAGPVSVMRFAGVAGVGAVCHGWGAGASVIGQAELTAAVRWFEALQDAALSPRDSHALIREMIASRR